MLDDPVLVLGYLVLDRKFLVQIVRYPKCEVRLGSGFGENMVWCEIVVKVFNHSKVFILIFES